MREEARVSMRGATRAQPAAAPHPSEGAPADERLGEPALI
jgi:hypothetical protein